MNRFLIILFTIGIYSGFTVEAKKSYALVVAISQYPGDSEWRKINAQNDADLLIPQLKKQGFEVTFLQNEKATKNSILSELKELIKKLHKGDLIFIHFSTHGQQMEDDSGDEIDGWDEALIPYDAELAYEKGVYEGGNHLRDDEFNYYLLQMRKKAGSSGVVIVSLDACHSASATRDEGEAEEACRGTARRFTPTGKTYDKPAQENNHYADIPLVHPNGYAPITVVSACKSYQVNQEIRRDNKSYGPLSYYLVQILKDKLLTEPQTWASSLFSLMKQNTKQTPVIESTLPINIHEK